ncbi:MAG: CorA family divalent cation transporter, partial [Pseudomonadota bacterium]
KESALVLQDDLNNRAAQETNKTMYMLSIVAAIFLPLGFLTGLLGINVGGMPGVDTPTAFWVVVVLLIGVMALQYYLFKKLKWL